MKPLNKYEFAKRSTLVSKLDILIALKKDERVAKILCDLVSHWNRIDGGKNPYFMEDNEFLGHVEKELKKIEDGYDEE